MAAPSIFRFFRYLRSFLLPIAAVGALVFLLSAFLVLYQPLQGPEHVQRVGWQSWSIISLYDNSMNHTGQGSGSVTEPQHGSDVDWWNVTQHPDAKLDGNNFPLDVWNPLLLHDTGCTCYDLLAVSLTNGYYPVSEIDVVGCPFPPALAWGNLCKPSTTTEKDAIKGKWVQVGGNLDAESSIYNLVRLLAN